MSTTQTKGGSEELKAELRIVNLLACALTSLPLNFWVLRVPYYEFDRTMHLLFPEGSFEFQQLTRPEYIPTLSELNL